ncbi:MAG: TIGR04083 family peptide-modifying radical SAM enzyme [Anaerolineae bacterium]|nr:TIGR04083 family peptide-modifying radical SAM enzyme [Anaerolineae bacterium]
MSYCFMIMPTLACQAKCSYCFSPHSGTRMSPEIAKATIKWINSQVSEKTRVEILFHGGEPLIVGHNWYEQVFNTIDEYTEGHLDLSVQSNFWLLDKQFCQIFKSHSVSLGTSLDGPAWINDKQRGSGYYERTMKGIQTARHSGLSVGVICTFTALSAPYYQDVFQFFQREQLPFGIHTVVNGMNENAQGLSMSPVNEGELLTRLFDIYVDTSPSVKITTFDTIARSISRRKSTLCTFSNCLGHYYAIGPEGYIYPCNRFVGHSAWRLGHVMDNPSLTDLSQTTAWQRLADWYTWIIEVACANCVHLNYCYGGCPYNALAFSEENSRDPKCPTYNHLFEHIINRALIEVFSEENIETVLETPNSCYGLLQKGSVISLMNTK